MALLLLGSGPVLAATSGPVYPLPGGPGTGHGGSTCLASSNDPIAMGSASGQTWYFGGGSDPAQTGTGCPFSATPTDVTPFDTTRFERLFWGVSSTPQLALDGTVDAPGETMTYSPTLSDRTAGHLVWTGSTTMSWCPPTNCPGYTVQPIATEFVLTATDLAGQPVPLLDPSTVQVDPLAGGLVEVTSALTRYKVNLQMLADDPTTPAADFVPAITMYNSLHHPPGGDPQTRMSVGGGFSYISRPPVGSITGDPANHVPTTLTAAATDPDGTIASYAWDTNNDGIFGSAQDNGNGSTATVDFGPGDHPIAVDVTDDDGVTTRLSRTITIVGQAPVAAFSCEPISVDQGVQSVCTSTSSDPDAVEGDTLTHAWDVNGDGQVGPGEPVGPTQVQVSYPDAGDHVITLFVTDRDGQTSTTQVTLQVADVTAPTVALTLTKQRLGSIIKTGIRGTLTSDEAGTGALTATLSSKLARKLKLRNPVARGTATLAAPGHVAVTLKLTKAAKRKFSTLQSVALKVTAQVTDQATNVGTTHLSRTYKK